jgi:hypothetical protein
MVSGRTGLGNLSEEFADIWCALISVFGKKKGGEGAEGEACQQ